MKIVSVEPLGITPEALAELSAGLTAAGHEFVSYDTREEDTPKLIDRVRDAEIVIVANQPFRAEVISACPKLKMISIAFTGVDHVDVAECKKRGIVLSNCAGYSTDAVAELVFGMIIDIYRYILPCDAAVRKEGTKGSMIGFEVRDKKIGIVGTGAIGMRVAEIAKAFHCEIVAYSRTQREDAKALGVKYVSLEELMRESDIVTLHVPVTGDTKNLIDAEKIGLMKKSAILINAARGGVIDNTALADALKAGKIAGAGIDVFEMEPPVPETHPLMDAPNTVMTPHVAFATKESLYKRAVIVFENVEQFLLGTPQNLI